MKLLQLSEENRKYGSTKSNQKSSRSHTVLNIKIEKRFKLAQNQSLEMNLKNPTEQPDQEQKTALMVTSTLYLVDLAGSERVKKSNASGERLIETQHINSSLSTLGKCIHELTSTQVTKSGGGHIPFRDSKLTRLLQNSLGGNSKTSLVVTIGPSEEDLEQTASSLYFGQRAMRIENQPIINTQRDLYFLNQKFKEELMQQVLEIDLLQDQKAEMTEHILGLERENLDLKMKLKSVDPKLVEKMSKQKQVQDVEKQYKKLIKNMEKEHRTFLEDIDKLMLEQEQDIENFKKENQQLRKYVKHLKKELQRSEKSLQTHRNKLRTQLVKLGIIQASEVGQTQMKLSSTKKFQDSTCKSDSTKNKQDFESEQLFSHFKSYFHRFVKERIAQEKLIKTLKSEIQLLYTEKGKNSKKCEKKRIAELLQIKVEIEQLKEQKSADQKTFKFKILKMQDEMREMEQNYEKEIFKLENKELENSDLRSEIEAKNLVILDLEARQRDFEARQRDFEAKQSESDSNGEILNRKIAKLENTLKDALKDAQNGSNMLESSRKKVQELEMIELSLREQLSDRSEELSSKIQKNESSELEFRSKIENLQSNLTKSEKMISNYESEIENLTTQLESTQKSLDDQNLTFQTQNQDHSNQIGQSELKIAKLESEMTEITQKHEKTARKLESQILKLEKQKSNHLDQIETLSEELKDSNDEIGQMSREIEKLITKIEDLEKNLREKDQKIEKTILDKETKLQDETLKMQEKIDLLKKSSKKSQIQIQNFEKECETLTKDNILLSDSLKKIEAEFCKINQKNLEIEKQKSSLIDQLSQQKSDLKNTNHINQELTSQMQKIMKKYEEAQNRNTKLQSDLRNLFQQDTNHKNTDFQQTDKNHSNKDNKLLQRWLSDCIKVSTSHYSPILNIPSSIQQDKENFKQAFSLKATKNPDQTRNISLIMETMTKVQSHSQKRQEIRKLEIEKTKREILKMNEPSFRDPNVSQVHRESESQNDQKSHFVNDLTFMQELEQKITKNINLDQYFKYLDQLHNDDCEHQMDWLEGDNLGQILNQIEQMELPFVENIFLEMFTKQLLINDDEINRQRHSFDLIHGMSQSQISKVLRLKQNLDQNDEESNLNQNAIQEQNESLILISQLTHRLFQSISFIRHQSNQSYSQKKTLQKLLTLTTSLISKITKQKIQLLLSQKSFILQKANFMNRLLELHNDNRKMNVQHQQYEEYQQREKAAVVIQRFFKEKRQMKEQKREIKKVQNKVEYMVQNYDLISSDFQNLNANTGRHLMKVSHAFYDKLFSNILSRFAFAKNFEQLNEKITEKSGLKSNKK